MKRHRRRLGSGPSLVKFRRRMFIGINQLDISPAEQARERDRLRILKTEYKLPEIPRRKNIPVPSTVPKVALRIRPEARWLQW